MADLPNCPICTMPEPLLATTATNAERVGTNGLETPTTGWATSAMPTAIY